jgi:hypothetical protein
MRRNRARTGTEEETDRESGISRGEVPDDRAWHRMVALDEVLIGRSKESKSGVAERERA